MSEKPRTVLIVDNGRPLSWIRALELLQREQLGAARVVRLDDNKVQLVPLTPVVGYETR